MGENERWGLPQNLWVKENVFIWVLAFFCLPGTAGLEAQTSVLEGGRILT